MDQVIENTENEFVRLAINVIKNSPYADRSPHFFKHLDQSVLTAASHSHPELVLRFAAGELTADSFAIAVKAAPKLALQFAIDRLTLCPDLWVFAVEKEPEYAIRFAIKSLRRNPALFENAARAAPSYALQYAAYDLTPELRQQCVSKCPSSALAYASQSLDSNSFVASATAAPWDALKYAPERLSQYPDLQKAAVERSPVEALKHSASWLTDALLVETAKAHPLLALEHVTGMLHATGMLGNRMPRLPGLLDELAGLCPEGALRYAGSYLSTGAYEAAVKSKPWEAFLFTSERLGKHPDLLAMAATAEPEAALGFASEFLSDQLLEQVLNALRQQKALGQQKETEDDFQIMTLADAQEYADECDIADWDWQDGASKKGFVQFLKTEHDKRTIALEDGDGYLQSYIVSVGQNPANYPLVVDDVRPRGSNATNMKTNLAHSQKQLLFGLAEADDLHSEAVSQSSLVDIAAAAIAHPEHALQFAAKYLTSELLSVVAAAKPSHALMFANPYLSDESRAAAAKAAPEHALQYGVGRLSPESLAEAARAEPYFAIRFAVQHLSAESLADAAIGEPRCALEYAAQHLSPESLALAATRFPYFAVRFAAHHLSVDSLVEAAAAEPHAAEIYLTPELIKQVQSAISLPKNPKSPVVDAVRPRGPKMGM